MTDPTKPDEMRLSAWIYGANGNASSIFAFDNSTKNAANSRVTASKNRAPFSAVAARVASAGVLRVFVPRARRPGPAGPHPC